MGQEDRKHYQVNDLFHTIQGEGRLAGTPATFIRLQGCLVGCPWCDTKYTWLKGGTRQTVEDIVSAIEHPHVVITGGEPTLYDLDNLMTALWDEGVETIQLETSGQYALKGRLVPDWVTISPKHMIQFRVPKELLQWASELKFVVDDILEISTVVDLAKEALRVKVPRPHESVEQPYTVLMPEGCPPRPEMVQKAMSWLKDHSDWYLSDRLQYRWDIP